MKSRPISGEKALPGVVNLSGTCLKGDLRRDPLDIFC